MLQNVEVLSAGERLQPDPSGKPQNVKVVTVLLNPTDAEKLMLSSNQGTVQFVLRNGSDQAQVESRPVQLSELRGKPAASAGPRVTRGAAYIRLRRGNLRWYEEGCSQILGTKWSIW